MPKVSVIIPVYNVEKYIEDCITSVLQQTLEDIELICVDDCSTDLSPAFLRQFEMSDTRIKIYHNHINSGQSVSRNKGMQHATGEYLYFLDSDDMIVPEALETLYRMASQLDLDILYFDTKQIFEIEDFSIIVKYKEKHSVYTHEPLKGTELFCRFDAAFDWDVSVCRQFYKRKFIEENHLRFADGILHEDGLFSLEAALGAERAWCEPYQGHIYRRHQNSTMTSTSDEMYIDRIVGLSYVYEKFKGYMEDYKDTDICLHIGQISRNTARAMVRYYKQIDAIRVSDSDSMEKLKTVSMLTTALYGGFFPYKLSPEHMRRIRQANHVVIYGAGEVGKGLLELLTERNVDVDCFAVTTLQQEYVYMGHSVYGISSLKENRHNTIVLIAVRGACAEDMKKTAEKNGFTDIMIMEC